MKLNKYPEEEDVYSKKENIYGDSGKNISHAKPSSASHEEKQIAVTNYGESFSERDHVPNRTQSQHTENLDTTEDSGIGSPYLSSELDSGYGSRHTTRTGLIHTPTDVSRKLEKLTPRTLVDNSGKGKYGVKITSKRD